ncbi:MAG: heat shock protein HspQ [Rhodospirillales bacterium]|nr:heat shock protein HspQ [Rhodospirillales bacterium]
MRSAKFRIGEIVRHRIFEFRGVVYDVDPVFANTEEWYKSIPPAVRPRKDQPFYHLYAVNADQGPYQAYVSEQNLLNDSDNGPVDHPEVRREFAGLIDGIYQQKRDARALN